MSINEIILLLVSGVIVGIINTLGGGGSAWHVLESDHVSALVSSLRIFLSHGKAKS